MTTSGLIVWALVGAHAAVLVDGVIWHDEKLPRSSWHAPAQILITAAAFAALAWRLGPSPAMLAPSWLAATGVVLAAIDLRSGRLPDRLVLPSYLAVPGLAAVTVLNGTSPTALLRAALGMAVLLLFYGLLYAVFPGHLGGGDLKLAGPVGFLLAWQGCSALLTGTVLAWVLASLALLLWAVAAPRTGDRSLPLGPFLIGSALGTMLWLPWDPSIAPPGRASVVVPLGTVTVFGEAATAADHQPAVHSVARPGADPSRSTGSGPPR